MVAGDLGTIRTEFGTLRSPGVRLQPRAPAARARLRRRPVPRRHRGHPRRDHRRDRPARRRRPAQAAGRARLRDHGRRRPTPCWPSSRTAPPRSRVSTGASSTSSGAAAATPRCRRCPAATASCSSRSSATTRPRCRPRAARVLADAGALDGFAVQDPTEALALWKIREDGAGLAGVSLAEPAYAGWEDAAVPPARLGALPARLRRAAHRVRARRAAVRALRRRLRARADRLPADQPGRLRRLPALRRAGRDRRRVVRRVDVGRARRRPGARRAAAGDVLPCRDRAVRPGQGRVRPRQPAQPGRARRPGPRGRRPADRRAGRPPAAGQPALLRRGAQVLRRRQVPGEHDRRAGRDVPLVPGDAGGEGLHPGPRPRPAGAGQRHAGRRLAGP